MTPTITPNRYVGFGGEVTPGTAGTIDQFLRVVDSNIRFMKDPFFSQENNPGWHDEMYYRAGKSQGPVVFEDAYTGLELYWHAMFGTYSFTINSPVSGAHTHAFSFVPSTNNHPAISIEQVEGLGGSTERTYLGMRPEKATVEFAPGKILTTTFDMVGMGYQVGSATAPTFQTKYPVLPSHKSSFTLGGNNITALSGSIEFTVPRASDREHYGDSVFKDPIVRGRPQATFKLEGEWDNSTGADLEQFLQDYEAENKITGLVLGHQGGIITGATPRSWQMASSYAKIKASQPQGGQEQVTRVTVEGQILSSLTLVLVNGTGTAVT